MRSGVKGLWADKRGSSFEGLALSVSIIAVGFVASADLLDYATKSPKVDVAKLQHPAPVVTADGRLDYAPTASLPRLISRSVLDPCTGIVK